MQIGKIKLLITCCLFLTAGVLIGNLMAKVKTYNQKPFNSLRQTGYKYISPLLLCEQNINSKPPELESLNQQIEQYIANQIESKNLITGSVLYRDFTSNQSLIINPDQEYVPASLFKIPMMVSLYKTAENNPGFLDQTEKYTDGNNNSQQFQIPEKSMDPGSLYTVRQGIEMMIRYSDNNSLNFLNHFISSVDYQTTFRDLKIPLTLNATEKNVMVNIESYSYFFRTLYNATYLNREYSEKALELLTQTNYKNGLVAGIPADVPVAHKFGSATISENGQTVNELHDCGIVYNPSHPYLLCIMTKSSQTIPQFEHVLAGVSKIVYTGSQSVSIN